MGFTEIFVMGFLLTLVYLAVINSRKTSKELKELNNKK